MNGGGAGLLEQDAHRRGVGGAGACRTPAGTGFFFLENLLVQIGTSSVWHEPPIYLPFTLTST
jgi:hypothetical protein